MKNWTPACLLFSKNSWFLVLLLLAYCSYGQGEGESARGKFLDDFRGTASITQNGISLVPSFSLGDPAALFDLKFIKGRFSFEPDMRFALEGNPWSMLFWFRYKAIQKERFSLRIGAHPGLNFRTVTIIRDGQEEDLLESRRYLAGEIVPNYKLSDRFSLGFFYLHGRGFDEGVKQTNFLVFNTSFTNIPLAGDYYFNFNPQVYYLSTDDLVGYYYAAFLTLAKQDFPFSLTLLINKGFDTEILPDETFTWSLLLNYSFPRKKKTNDEKRKL